MDISTLASLLLTFVEPAPLPVQFEPDAARVVLYPSAPELRMLSALELSPDAQAAFDNDFRDASYYAAFAFSKSGGWGFATMTNSLDAARAIALGECLDVNDACRIVAEIVPPGYRPPRPGDITLSPEVAAMYRNPEAAGAPPASSRALAVSADGAYALSWGHLNQTAANEAALADCAKHVVRDLPDIPEMPCILVPGLPGPN